MRNYKNFLVMLVLFVFGTTAQAQETQAKRADTRMERFAYIDAIKLYEHVANKGYHTPEVLQNLGDANYFNGKLPEANKWYTILFEETDAKEIASEYFYRYAQTLKSIEEYDRAAVVLKQFEQLEAEDIRTKLIEESKDYMAKIEANSGRYELKNLPFNSEASDYGTTIYDGKLIFASARKKGTVSKKIHSWTSEYFTNLYSVEIKEDGTYGDLETFAKKLNTKFNESTPVLSKDGQTMYFSRNNFNKGKRGKNSEKTTLLKIYKSSKDEKGKWSEAEELPFNSNAFSTAHPALTADGKWMYFVSDRANGFGKSDLYKVEIKENGSFGLPTNLGEKINTEGRESFPFITENDELYFSTDGRPGLGGFDIFVTKIKEDGSFSEIQNIGAPANGPLDDFAFYINVESKRGFLSSNRSNGVGKDDIYSFEELNPLVLDCIQGIEGIVFDTKTKERLPFAEVKLYDADFNLIAEGKADENAFYTFPNLPCGAKFRINASLEGYNTVEKTVELPNENGVTKADLELEKERIKIKKGDDLFKVLNLNPIYFDLDKHNIRPDAAAELAKVHAVLIEYPTMKIDIRSHTDSRASHKYNEDLSSRRAKSTSDWLVANGINRARLTWKGYGETQLVNECADGVPCSEEAHQLNRRSEFIVIEL